MVKLAVLSVLLFAGGAAAETRPQHRLAAIDVELVDGLPPDAVVVQAGPHRVELPVTDNRATWRASGDAIVRAGEVVVVQVMARGEVRCKITHELAQHELVASEVVATSDCITRARLGFATRHVLVAPAPRPPYPLELEEVPLPAGPPRGYFAISLGSVSSLYSHFVVGLDLVKSLRRAPWLFARARALAGAPAELIPGGRHPPNGSRKELRVGLEARHCGATACVFAGLDAGYYAESIKSCDGQECIVVDERDEQGMFAGGSAGVDLGTKTAGFRMAVEAFGTPNNTVGVGVMFGLTGQLWHDRDAAMAARRRTIAFARTERMTAQTDCSRVEDVTARLAREDKGLRDVFVRDPYVATCLQIAEADAATARDEAAAREVAAREAAKREEAAAREAAVLAITESARRRIEEDPCLAKRAAILRTLRDVTNAIERGKILATLPTCD